MLGKLHRSQKGFTLIELIIALAIASAIGVAVTMTAHSMITIPSMSNDSNTAINQVRNAVHWISRDALTAQTVAINNTPGELMFLEFTRTDLDDSELHTISYSFESMPDGLNKLNRSETDNSGTMQTIIAQYIRSKEADVTECSWDDVTNILSVTITATAVDEIETRTFKIKPRPTD